MEKVHFYAKIDSSPTFKVWVSEKATKFEKNLRRTFDNFLKFTWAEPKIILNIRTE